MKTKQLFCPAAWRCAALAAILLVITSTLVAPAATVYDFATDWSDSANPNGSWSYNEGSNPLPHVNWWQRNFGGWAVAQPGWARSEDGLNRVPFWFKSNGSEVWSGVALWQPGDVLVHTADNQNGMGNGPANVTWTSPFMGVINLSGGVWMERDIGRGNGWTLYKNGAALTGGNIFSGDPYSRTNPFAFALGSGGAAAITGIPVVPGDVIKLEFVKTSDYGDFVGMNFTVTPVAPLNVDIDADFPFTVITQPGFYSFNVFDSSGSTLSKTFSGVDTNTVPTGVATLTVSAPTLIITRERTETPANSPPFTLNALYRDFMAVAGGPFTITLQGLATNTWFDVSFYAYDNGNALSADANTDTFTSTTSGASSPSASITYGLAGGGLVSSNSQCRVTLRVKSDSDGTLTFTESSSGPQGGPVLNGLQVATVPQLAIQRVGSLVRLNWKQAQNCTLQKSGDLLGWTDFNPPANTATDGFLDLATTNQSSFFRLARPLQP